MRPFQVGGTASQPGRLSCGRAKQLEIDWIDGNEPEVIAVAVAAQLLRVASAAPHLNLFG